jgi:Leucine-rich repeat (LRR) protein
LYNVLVRQKALGLSDCLMDDIKKKVTSHEKLVPGLRKRIEASWAGFGKALAVGQDGTLKLSLSWQGDSVRELSPLRDMPLTYLDLANCYSVDDLTPLKGMPLTTLILVGCTRVHDLGPLRGMRLTTLNVGASGVQDLTPLQGMPLSTLTLNHTRVADLTPLKGMPLTNLYLDATRVRDLSPLQGMSLARLQLSETPVRDLSPLQGMNLTILRFSPKNISKGMEVVRQMKTLQTINDMPSVEFWKKDAAGEFSK